jgi:hypothetical protein
VAVNPWRWWLGRDGVMSHHGSNAGRGWWETAGRLEPLGGSTRRHRVLPWRCKVAEEEDFVG